MAGAPAYPGGAPSCTADGDLLFCARERGATHLYVLRGDAASPEPLVAGPQRVVSALAVATEAPVAAFVLTTERSFGEIATVDVRTGEVAVLTDFTASAFEGVELATAEEREFEISDGTRVQAWLLSAPGAEGAAPLLLHVHGGPHNAWSGVADAVHLYQQVLAARGWRVLMVNPRGSDGFGDDFMRAVDGAWGKADAADFLEPLDQLVAEGIADPDRLAVTGYSYGGFMTCELTTRTDRFRAAVAGGLLCDFVPLAADGENATYFSRLTTGVDPTSGHERLAAASPITRVDAVKTPTLILHGDADELCPVSQAREWFSALRINGVPAQLAVYPGQSHLLPLSAPTPTRIDFTKRIVDWVERHTRVRRAVPADPRVSDAAHWQRRLDELARLHGVVGAQFGIVELDDDGDVLATTRAASGVLDASTGQPATLDSVFQIGSITKVWTAILVMQLVDEGLLDLDAPVRSVLPDFTTADPESSERITVRHLLTHTSGMDGDLFTNTGRGDDCVERYVASLSTAAQITPVGERFSYCNSGFVLAGRIVEALRDTTWDEALRRWIIEPLGLTQTVTLLDDVPRFATATGHTGAGALAAPVPVWPITRSMGPAGLIDASVGDLLTFAAAAMRGGVAPNGTRILSEAAHHAMLEEQVSLRDAVTSTAAWSLGWFLQDWNGRTVYGHDGGTIGQRAYLRILPGARTAIALLTTGGHADGLYHDLFAEAAQLVDGTVIADPLAAGDRGGDAPLGEYRTAGTHVLVAQKESGFQLEVTPLTDLLRTGEAPPATLIDLVPSDVDGVWAFTTPDLAGWSQFRPVPGGAYMGYRFLPAVAPS
nr:serine hydrolase [Microbacterium immunditiarum]